MKKWLTRNREAIVPLLIVVVATLILVNLIKHGLLTVSGLASNKDALAALNSSVSIIVIAVGALFSYYRFFRGRTFYARAELNIQVTVIDTPEDFNIHVVTLIIKNIGTLSIWEPMPILKTYEQGPKGVTSQIWDNWRESSPSENETEMLAVIDSGEIAYFTHHHRVSKEVWAVTFSAYVRSHTNEMWKNSITVKNKSADSSKES
jgi:hypothetical protein